MTPERRNRPSCGSRFPHHAAAKPLDRKPSTSAGGDESLWEATVRRLVDGRRGTDEHRVPVAATLLAPLPDAKLPIGARDLVRRIVAPLFGRAA